MGLKKGASKEGRTRKRQSAGSSRRYWCFLCGKPFRGSFDGERYCSDRCVMKAVDLCERGDFQQHVFSLANGQQ